MTDMEMQMIRALAEIDRELGMPDDGCNSTENTITAIRLLHAVRRDDEAEIERLRAALVKIECEPINAEYMARAALDYVVPNAVLSGKPPHEEI